MDSKNLYLYTATLLTILIATSSTLTLPNVPNQSIVIPEVSAEGIPIPADVPEDIQPAVPVQVQGKLPAVQNTLRVVPVYRVQQTQSEITPRGVVGTTKVKVQADLCPICIQFTDQAINQLLNIILNAGVVETCATLCNALAQKTGSQLIGAACNILCDIEGVQEFVKIVEKADLDPIYFCEELKTCPVFDGGDAFITKITVTPLSGPQGERDIAFNYTSKNGTGTGEIIVSVRTLDGIPVESSFLQEPQQAGNYTKTLTLKAEPDPDCDPTQQPCEMWRPGNYSVAIEICNGECGSKHPHSKIYDKKMGMFVIT